MVIKLQTKMLLYVSVILIVALGLSAFLARQAVSLQLQNSLTESVKNDFRAFDIELEQIKDRIIKETGELARDDDVVKAFADKDQQGLMKVLEDARLLLGMDTALAADLKGGVIGRSHNPGFYGDNVSVYSVSDTGSQCVVTIEQTTLGVTVVANCTVFSNGLPLGILQLGVSLNHRFISVFNRKYGVDVTVFDSERIQATTFTSPEMVQGIAAVYRNLRNSGNDDLKKVRLNGHDYYISLKQLNSYDGKNIASLVMAYSEASSKSAIGRLSTFFFVTAFLLIIIALLVSVKLTHIVVAPIEKLSDVSICVAHGDFTQKLEVESGDELGQLAATFNYMIAELRKSTISIEDLNKEVEQRKSVEAALRKSEKELHNYRLHLEKLVEERTAELAEANDKLTFAKDVAIQASKSKSEFLANMSHEIRTPMNAVLGFAELLQRKEEDPKKKSYIDNIYTWGKNLLKLINDILDLSKVEAGKLELHYSAVCLAELCKQIVDPFKLKAAKKELSLSLHVSGDLPEFLYVEAMRIRQVLTNLIANSVKFTDKGSIEIKVGCEFPEGKKDNMVDLNISVKDSGIGIAADQLDVLVIGLFVPRVFELFVPR